jgi:protein-L-isoaspartate(D-aspartate) O-methyltransferase
MTLEDNFRQQGLRNQLIETMKNKGITNDSVLEAMRSVPRHWFLDTVFLEKAYEDVAFPIGEDQTISHPYTVAYMTSLLEIKKREKVLEIGTGSGYQGAVLSKLGAKVYSIERNKVLYSKTKKFLSLAGIQIQCYLGDGTLGLPQFAPFDKIIVTAGGPEIPQKLMEQLSIGGLMVIPVGDKNIQKMIRIQRISATEFQKEELKDFRFVPLLGEQGW